MNSLWWASFGCGLVTTLLALSCDGGVAGPTCPDVNLSSGRYRVDDALGFEGPHPEIVGGVIEVDRRANRALLEYPDGVSTVRFRLLPDGEGDGGAAND